MFHIVGKCLGIVCARERLDRNRLVKELAQGLPSVTEGIDDTVLGLDNTLFNPRVILGKKLAVEPPLNTFALPLSEHA